MQKKRSTVATLYKTVYFARYIYIDFKVVVIKQNLHDVKLHGLDYRVYLYNKEIYV